MRTLILFLLTFPAFSQAIPTSLYVVQGSASYGTQCWDPKEVAVTGAGLVLTAEHVTSPPCGLYNTSPATQPYTSAKVMFNVVNAQYGIIQFSETLPATMGSGIWPTVWMEGSQLQLPHKTGASAPNRTCAGWPVAPGCDEIDLLEFFGSTTPALNLHTGTMAGVDVCSGDGGSCGCTSANLTPGSTHVFKITWAAGTITRTVDGGSSCNVTSANVSSSSMFLMAEFAVGGASGTPNPAQFPLSMTLQYIRWCPAGTVTCDAAHATVFDAEFQGTGPQSDIYIGEQPSGLATGLDCADSFGVLIGTQTTWINNAGYFTNGQIGPGTNLHICNDGGTLSTTLTMNGSGASGSPITLINENNSVLPTISMNGQSYIFQAWQQKGASGGMGSGAH